MKIKIPSFKTKSELYDFLIANKSEIIELKKSTLKECDGFGGSEIQKQAVKAVANENQQQDTDTELYRTIVGNTYYWLDSHDDVHLSACFGVSIKQRGVGKINHLHDHIQQLDAKVGKFTEVYEKTVPWSLLGVDRIGETEALMGNSTIKRELNSKIFDQYKSGEIDQHSVGMMYDDVKLAINDPSKKDEFAEWNKHIYKLGNPEKAEAQGFFWAVYQAKLREISCVIAGSNEITPTLEIQSKLGPLDDSQVGNKQTPDPRDSSTVIKSNYYLTI